MNALISKQLQLFLLPAISVLVNGTTIHPSWTPHKSLTRIFLVPHILHKSFIKFYKFHSTQKVLDKYFFCKSMNESVNQWLKIFGLLPTDEKFFKCHHLNYLHHQVPASFSFRMYTLSFKGTFKLLFVEHVTLLQNWG